MKVRLMMIDNNLYKVTVKDGPRKGTKATIYMYPHRRAELASDSKFKERIFDTLFGKGYPKKDVEEFKNNLKLINNY
jgi:hypothetical protein